MIAIRACAAEDCAGAVALWTRSGLTRPWNDPEADFQLALASPSSTLLGGFSGPSLVATVMAGFDGHRGWLYYLAVEAEHRRRGLGSRMVEAAETWLRQLGAPKLQFMVREENAAALRFYERLGFERQSVVTLGRRLD